MMTAATTRPMRSMGWRGHTAGVLLGVAIGLGVLDLSGQVDYPWAAGALALTAVAVVASHLPAVFRTVLPERYDLCVLLGLGAVSSGGSIIGWRAAAPYLVFLSVVAVVAAEARSGRLLVVDLAFRANAVGGGIVLFGLGVPIARDAFDGSLIDAVMTASLSGGVALAALGIAVVCAGLGTLCDLLAKREYADYRRIILSSGFVLADRPMSIGEAVASGCPGDPGSSG